MSEDRWLDHLREKGRRLAEESNARNKALGLPHQEELREGVDFEWPADDTRIARAVKTLTRMPDEDLMAVDAASLSALQLKLAWILHKRIEGLAYTPGEAKALKEQSPPNRK